MAAATGISPTELAQDYAMLLTIADIVREGNRARG